MSDIRNIVVDGFTEAATATAKMSAVIQLTGDSKWMTYYGPMFTGRNYNLHGRGSFARLDLAPMTRTEAEARLRFLNLKITGVNMIEGDIVEYEVTPVNRVIEVGDYVEYIRDNTICHGVVNSFSGSGMVVFLGTNRRTTTTDSCVFRHRPLKMMDLYSYADNAEVSAAVDETPDLKIRKRVDSFKSVSLGDQIGRAHV